MSDRNLRLKLIFEALDKMTGPMKNIGGGTEQMRKALAAARAESRALSVAQRDLTKFKDIEVRSQKDAAALAAQEKATKALREEIGRLGVPTKKMAQALQNAERNENKLRESHNKHGQSLAELSRKLEAAGADIADLVGYENKLAMQTYEANKALKDQTAKLDQLNAAKKRADNLKSAGGNMMATGTGMVGAGVAMGAPAYFAYDQAKTFEASVADIKKVMDFTPEAFKAINSDLLDMSTRVPIAANGLAQIAAAAGRAGVGQQALREGRYGDARRDLMAFTEDAAKMGVAFDMTAEEAGNTMAIWRTAFELPQSEIASLGDKVNALTNTFGGSAVAISEVLARVGPLGRVAGVTAPHMAAMAQVMNATGVQSEIAGTGIKNVMLALTKGTAATKMQNAAFAQLGLNAQAVAKNMQIDSGGTILDVLERISKLPKHAQAGVLTQLFGSESVAAIAPLLGNLDQLKENFALVGDESRYAGSMTEEFLARIAVNEGAVGLLTNSFNALNITLGTATLPVITDLANGLTPVLSGWRKWAEANPAVSGGLTVFVGIIAALTTLLGGLAIGAGALTWAFGALGITTWAALWPILAIIAGLAVLGAGIYLVVKYFDDIKRVGGEVWTAIQNYVAGAITFMVQAFQNFTPLGLFMQGIMAIFDWVKSLDLGKIGGDIVQGIIDGITGGIPGMIGAFVNMAGAGIDAFKKALGIKSPSRVMMALAGYVNDGLAGGLAATQTKPIARMRSIADAISDQVRVGAQGNGAIPLALGVSGRATSASGSGASMTFGDINIGPIVAAPGQSEADIARMVMDLFKAHLEKLQARKRSDFSDGDN